MAFERSAGTAEGCAGALFAIFIVFCIAVVLTVGGALHTFICFLSFNTSEHGSRDGD